MSSFTVEPEFRNDGFVKPNLGKIKIGDVWHNIVFVYDDDANEFKMYLDGIKVTSIEGVSIELTDEAHDTRGVHHAAYG